MFFYMYFISVCGKYIYNTCLSNKIALKPFSVGFGGSQCIHARYTLTSRTLSVSSIFRSAMLFVVILQMNKLVKRHGQLNKNMECLQQ